jgi:hypothetical protein
MTTDTPTETAQPTTAAPSPFERLYHTIKDSHYMKSALFDRDLGRVMARIPGWSHIQHFIFFRALMEATNVQRVLVLGVFHGRDIALLKHAHRAARPDVPLTITGVDRFADAPCDDWTEEDKTRNWRDNGYGIGPASPDIVRDNLERLDVADGVTIVQSSDEPWLDACQETFDCIYIDTAHDYETVMRQIRQVRRLCAGPDTIICGDDFYEAPTFGVVQAVKESFGQIGAAGQCWFSDLSRLQK